MPNETSFELPLDYGVRARVRFERLGDGRIKYCYQLEVEEGGDYVWIRRYDNYNRPPHFHYRRADGTEMNHLPMNVSDAEAQTIAHREILSDWERYVGEYREGRR